MNIFIISHVAFHYTIILKSELATILRSERDAIEKYSPGVIRQELV